MRPLEGRRILVVEDEVIISMQIEDVLMEAGAEIVGPAATVATALSILAASRDVDAAAIDLNLVGQSAAPVADALDARGIPFVMLTGYGAEGLAGSRRDGIVVSKPFEPPVLVAVMSRLLGR